MADVVTQIGRLRVRQPGPFTSWWHDLMWRASSLRYIEAEEGGVWWGEVGLIMLAPKMPPDVVEFIREPRMLDTLAQFRDREVVELPSDVTADSEDQALFVMEDGRRIWLDLKYVEYLAKTGYRLFAIAGGSRNDPVVVRNDAGQFCGLLLPLNGERVEAALGPEHRTRLIVVQGTQAAPKDLK